MASQFPTSPTAGDRFYLAGKQYEYSASLGWVKTTQKTTPTTPTGYTKGIAQFTTGTTFGFQQIYENIYDAYLNNTGVLRNLNNAGNPSWNTSSYASSLWNGLRMIRLMPTNNNWMGIIDIPAGAQGGLLWLRVIMDDPSGPPRENAIRMRPAGNNTQAWQWYTWSDDNIAQPVRISPYGYMGETGGDQSYNHYWVCTPLPAGVSQVEFQFRTGYNTADGWVSGLAFTDNPRGWAATNAITSHRGPDCVQGGPTIPDWAGTSLGHHRFLLQGHDTDTASSSPTNGQGPKRFPVFCDINGNDKRILFQVEENTSYPWQHPWFLKAGTSGTWKTPEQCITTPDWMSVNIGHATESWASWVYEVSAADIAAAACVGPNGGTLSNMVMLNMYMPRTDSMAVANIFTYDA